MYKTGDIPSNATNHGQLISPPFSVSLLKLRDNRGDLLDNKLTDRKHKPSLDKRSNGQWLMLYLHPGPCGKLCQRRLYDMRQIRIATGKDRNRVERAILTYQNDTEAAPLRNIIQPKYSGTRHFTIKKQQFALVIQQHVPASYALQMGVTYLVDPLGNVMMIYKPGASSSAIFKDIQRLLRVSRIG